MHTSQMCPPRNPSLDLDVRFELKSDFVHQYLQRKAPFGFNGLGEFVYRRTYSRIKDDGNNEQWHETVERVVNGTMSLQKRHCVANELVWDEAKAHHVAEDMFERVFTMKFLPPGRGLWAMGSPLTEERQLYAALNNCAFVSTAGLEDDPSGPFTFLMDAAMLGVGVGFDTLGSNYVVRGVDDKAPAITFSVEDTREGWVESLRMLLLSHFQTTPRIVFDYSNIRPIGALIKGFGGVASGPSVLRDLHVSVDTMLRGLSDRKLGVTGIVDIMNLIGKCVVAGNVRRTAEIAFGDPDDPEYVHLKDYERNPHRAAYGWTSNNSVFANVGMDYSHLAQRIASNGEPGVAWLDNMRSFSRMNGVVDNKDHKAGGGNPCMEQTLESFEMCCLVETFPAHHDTLEDYHATLRAAFLYAKTVTLGLPHWRQTSEVMARNRRIGCSMTGVAQFLAKNDHQTLSHWCETGYKVVREHDAKVSEWLGVPPSIKVTSIKPSGTVSLLAGATSGMHFPESRFVVRRVRLASNSPLVKALVSAGHVAEEAVGEPNTVVVSFPVDVGDKVRTLDDVTMDEQLELAALLQRHWADNQVSCTVSFIPGHDDISAALQRFDSQLKAVAFLPRLSSGAYPQMPIEAIDEIKFETLRSKLGELDFSHVAVNPSDVDSFCDSEVCVVPKASTGAS